MRLAQFIIGVVIVLQSSSMMALSWLDYKRACNRPIRLYAIRHKHLPTIHEKHLAKGTKPIKNKEYNYMILTACCVMSAKLLVDVCFPKM